MTPHGVDVWSVQRAPQADLALLCGRESENRGVGTLRAHTRPLETQLSSGVQAMAKGQSWLPVFSHGAGAIPAWKANRFNFS